MSNNIWGIKIAHLWTIWIMSQLSADTCPKIVAQIYTKWDQICKRKRKKKQFHSKLNCFASDWSSIKLMNFLIAANWCFSLFALSFIWCKVFPRNSVVVMPNMKQFIPKLTRIATSMKTCHSKMHCRINATKNPISVFESNGNL